MNVNVGDVVKVINLPGLPINNKDAKVIKSTGSFCIIEMLDSNHRMVMLTSRLYKKEEE